MAVGGHGGRELPCIIEKTVFRSMYINRQGKTAFAGEEFLFLSALSGESLQKAGTGQREGLYWPSIMKDK